MKSIKRKIIVFALLSTLIPSIALGLLSFHQNESMITDNVTRELRVLANHASSELDAWINQNIHEASALTSSRMMIDVLSDLANLENGDIKTSPEMLNSYLYSVQEKLNTILELTVIDTNGEIIASSSDQSLLSKSLKNYLLNNGTQQQSLVLPPFWNETLETVIISIVLPVLSYENYILGQLVLTYDLHSIKPKLKDPIKSPRGEILMLDTDGTLLLASHTEICNQSIIDPTVLQALRNHPGKIIHFQDISQEHAIGLAYLANKLPITVVAERKHQDVYAAWIKQRNLFLILVCTSIFIVASIALYLGRSIVIPLKRLNDATSQIVKGNLNIPITVVTQKDELGKLAQMFNLMTEKLRQNQTEIMTTNEELLQKNRLLEELCVTDGLTGLYNRNKLNQIISDELSRAHRNKRPFAILMIDVDYFKQLNDSLGHIAGDEILTTVSRILAKSIRSIDFAARYGGDEFVIVLTETTAEEAAIIAERVRSQVSEFYCNSIKQLINVTLSIGITQSERGDSSANGLISRADTALYKAKKAGRNQARIIASET